MPSRDLILQQIQNLQTQRQKEINEYPVRRNNIVQYHSNPLSPGYKSDEAKRQAAIDESLAREETNYNATIRNIDTQIRNLELQYTPDEPPAGGGRSGGGGSGGGNGGGGSAGPQMPETAIATTQEEIRRNRARLERESRNRARLERASGMLSPSKEKIEAGLAYMESQGFNRPQFQPNPTFSQRTQDMMRPPIRSNVIRTPQLPGMAQQPITWEERNRILGITPPGQQQMPGLPTMNKPPVRRAPRPGEPGFVPGMMYGF